MAAPSDLREDFGFLDGNISIVLVLLHLIAIFRAVSHPVAVTVTGAGARVDGND
jgi:hypothetical protein